MANIQQINGASNISSSYRIIYQNDNAINQDLSKFKVSVGGSISSIQSSVTTLNGTVSTNKNAQDEINNIFNSKINDIESNITDLDFQKKATNSGTVGQVLTSNGDNTYTFKTPVSGGGGGTGDMEKSMYDPDSVNSNVFDMGNMLETPTKKILTSEERDKINYTLYASHEHDNKFILDTITQENIIEWNKGGSVGDSGIKLIGLENFISVPNEDKTETILTWDAPLGGDVTRTKIILCSSHKKIADFDYEQCLENSDVKTIDLDKDSVTKTITNIQMPYHMKLFIEYIFGGAKRYDEGVSAKLTIPSFGGLPYSGIPVELLTKEISENANYFTCIKDRDDSSHFTMYYMYDKPLCKNTDEDKTISISREDNKAFAYELHGFSLSSKNHISAGDLIAWNLNEGTAEYMNMYSNFEFELEIQNEVLYFTDPKQDLPIEHILGVGKFPYGGDIDLSQKFKNNSKLQGLTVRGANSSLERPMGTPGEMMMPFTLIVNHYDNQGQKTGENEYSYEDGFFVPYKLSDRVVDMLELVSGDYISNIRFGDNRIWKDFDIKILPNDKYSLMEINVSDMADPQNDNFVCEIFGNTRNNFVPYASSGPFNTDTDYTVKDGKIIIPFIKNDDPAFINGFKDENALIAYERKEPKINKMPNNLDMTVKRNDKILILPEYLKDLNERFFLTFKFELE